LNSELAEIEAAAEEDEDYFDMLGDY